MNRSHIEHTIVAVWLQVIPGVIWGDWIIGAVLAAGWFWSREHAQNEYKIIQARKGKRTPYEVETPRRKAKRHDGTRAQAIHPADA